MILIKLSLALRYICLFGLDVAFLSNLVDSDQYNLARVVRKIDNTIHRTNHYPVDSVVCFVNPYPLDSVDSVIQPSNNRSQL